MRHVQVTVNVITPFLIWAFLSAKKLYFKTLIIEKRLETKGLKYFYSKINLEIKSH